jgi:flagellar basal-body rod protein FlgG
MFKGFYNLTSGMLSQGRRLDVIANNMTNITTTGFKADHYTDNTSFDEYMLTRVGNKYKTPNDIGGASYILAPDQLYTDYNQGALEQTAMPLDFALQGDGFFAVQSQKGEGTVYTRSGTFTLDDEGYLCLPGEGRVLGSDNQPISLGTDQIQADSAGNLYMINGDEAWQNGQFLGQLGVFTFPDNGALSKTPRGLFTGAGAALTGNTPVHWQFVERANVDLVQEMVDMIASERALQSAANLSKMYDQVMTKVSTDLGRM